MHNANNNSRRTAAAPKSQTEASLRKDNTTQKAHKNKFTINVNNTTYPINYKEAKYNINFWNKTHPTQKKRTPEKKPKQLISTRVCWGSGTQIGEKENEKPTSKLEFHLPESTQPPVFTMQIFLTKQKRKKENYLRLLSTSAAAPATTTTTAALIAMYVVVDSAPEEGATAGDGNGETGV